MVRIPFEAAVEQMKRVLLSRCLDESKAEKVACEMAKSSLEGTYSHGINRFARLVSNIDQGIVRVDVMPEKINGFGAIENYDGQLGLGIINASFCMDRSMELARAHGIGLVAIRNTNHWLRAASYALQACEGGMASMCFSNTMPNMPTWGATDPRLGNNPLTLGFPCEGGDIIVDMAMSQFSYGALELAKLEGREMPMYAGYDTNGILTKDPDEVIASKRILPTGYWKGAALSFILDIFAAGISLGNTTAAVGRLSGDEHGVSQVFIAINFRSIAPKDLTQAILDDAVANLLSSKGDGSDARIAYPGQRRNTVREKNAREGIPVDDGVWAQILRMTDEGKAR
jgi:3-dehydro-L-gulonate 2-dehydrogenase